MSRDHEFIEQHVGLMATHMLRKLRANMHKGGWRNDSVEALIARLREEVDEFDAACREGLPVYGEAADVANFAMMVADVASAERFARLLEQADPEGGES